MTDLVPTQQKQVTFYEAEITAVLIDGDIYASINNMCDALELDRQSQRRRIDRNDVLSDGLGVAIIATPKGGQQSTYVLRADLIPLWLAGVSTRRLDDDKRTRLVDFQKRAAKVLWEAFQRGELTDNLDIDALAAAGDELAETYKIGQAIMTLARNQLQLRQQQQLNTSQLVDHDRRLEALETAVSSPTRVISEAQAVSLSQAVKALAMELSKREKKNMYGAIWGEFYRRYDVNKYRMLPISKFDEAVAWLREWLHQVESETF